MLPDVTLRRVETGVTFLTGIECPTPASGDDLQRIAASGLVPLQRRSTTNASLYFTTASPDHGTVVAESGFATVEDSVITSALAAAPPVQGWTAVEAHLQLHDFGIGTVAVTWSPQAPVRLDNGFDTALIRCLDEATEALVVPMIEAAMLGLRTSFPGEPRADGVVSLLRSVEIELPSFGRALWVWSHLRIATDEPVDHLDAARRVATVVCPNDFTVLTHRDHSYAAGVGVSVTCSRAAVFDDGVALSWALPRQDAWWALVWALDRALLALQQRIDTTVAQESIASMIASARRIENVTTRIQLLRSRIDSTLVNAGARDLAVWRCLAEAWHLDLRLEVAQRKLQFLQNGYQTVVAETSRRRAEQVALMVYIFTAVSVIASAVAVIQYAQGTTATGATYRAVVLSVCVLAAVGAVLTSLRAQQLSARRAEA